jgi:peptidoglycan/xylan/chitin deacetylase (PgdA/CDA1 family)
VSSRRRAVVLCYHAVSAAWRHRLAIDPELLEAQVRSILRRGYRPGTARDVLRGEGKILHVTFDDAFRSVPDALPILERLGVPVTVFACTGYADGGRPLLVPELRSDDPADLEGLATLTWDELRGLAERGVEIGSHTVSHPHLPQLADAELARELRDSRERIEAELARPCPFLAYPYGQNDERVGRAAREAGYEAAWSLGARRPPLDPYDLPRADLYTKDTGWRTTLKTSPAYALGMRLRAAVAR